MGPCQPFAARTVGWAGLKDAPSTARRTRHALRPWAGLQVNYSICFYVGPCDYYLGRLTAALGKDADALTLLESAVAFVDAVPARPQRMVTRAALAHCLVQRGSRDDIERSSRLLQEAATLAREMRLDQRIAEYEGASMGASRTTSSLTQREHDVLALLASGSTNQQIAAQLHLSAKTVERHLSNLYRKLGVANRTEAATYAIRHSIGR